MSTTTLRSGNVTATHTVTKSFTDMMTSIAGAISVAGLVRNLSPNPLVVVKGGATAPDDSSSGELLDAFSAVYCETDHLWVRGKDGGQVAFETI